MVTFLPRRRENKAMNQNYLCPRQTPYYVVQE
jgi:hypothetical protein